MFTILHAKCRRTFVHLFYVMNKRPLSLFPQEDESVMTRGWFVGNNGSPSNADYARLPPTWILYHKTAPHFIIKPNLWSCIFLCLHPPVCAFQCNGKSFTRKWFCKASFWCLVWIGAKHCIAALEVWNAKYSSNPGSKSQKSLGRNRLLSFC